MSTVYEVLEKKYTELLESRRAAVVGGAVKDYAEYRAVCGEIRGLNLALQEVRDLAKLQQEIEDE